MKRPKIRTPSGTSLQKPEIQNKIKDISEMVSTTIRRLNDVNARVTRTLQDSISSSASFASLDTAINLIQPKPQQKTSEKNCADELSASSLNWSTVTTSNANDISDASIAPSKPIVAKKASRKGPAVKIKPPVEIQQQSSPQQQEVQQEQPNAAPSTVVEDVPFTVLKETLPPKSATPKMKKKRQKLSSETLKDKEESDKFENRESTSAKKRRSAKSKDVPSKIEPVASALKKSSAKKRKNKKKEHVSINSTPEVMPGTNHFIFYISTRFFFYQFCHKKLPISLSILHLIRFVLIFGKTFKDLHQFAIRIIETIIGKPIEIQLRKHLLANNILPRTLAIIFLIQSTTILQP